MKQLKEYIRKELKSLKEGKTVKIPLPDDAKKTLLGLLNLKKSHINNIHAVKSVKPTYRIYLNNNQSFTISDLGNNFNFGLVNISNKTYDILDRNQYPLALKALEDLQTKPIIKTTGDEESSSIEEPTEEPTEEPVEEPAEEPEA